MKLSVTISGLDRIFGDDLGSVVDVARMADDVGVDQLVLPDHVAIGSRLDRYPYGKAFPYPPAEPWLEPLTSLAAIAGATRRVRLGTGVLIAPLRPALLLAKTVASLDVLFAVASIWASGRGGNAKSSSSPVWSSSAAPSAWTTPCAPVGRCGNTSPRCRSHHRR